MTTALVTTWGTTGGLAMWTRRSPSQFLHEGKVQGRPVQGDGRNGVHAGQGEERGGGVGSKLGGPADHRAALLRDAARTCLRDVILMARDGAVVDAQICPGVPLPGPGGDVRLGPAELKHVLVEGAGTAGVDRICCRVG